jgi:glycerate kinase
VRIVAAPDSFKESMSAGRAAAAIAAGIHDVDPRIECIQLPLSDGGEGFVATIAGPLGATIRTASARDALGRPHEARFACAGRLAVLEVAEAVGLGQIPVAERDVMASATWGVGDLISAALDAGANELVIGLGGSATSDGGAGMLVALGLRLSDAQGEALSGTPASLAVLESVDATGLDPRLRDVRITIASDVRNPLLGPTGAAAVFGPQKGADPARVALIDEAVRRFAEISGKDDAADAPGAGAAGGLGFALLAFAGARFRPGIDVCLELCGFDDAAREADWVFTGEGSMDGQTLQGKAPWGVAQRARSLGTGVLGFTGTLGAGWERLLDAGFTAILPISRGPADLATALARGESDLRRSAATAVLLLCARPDREEDE